MIRSGTARQPHVRRLFKTRSTLIVQVLHFHLIFDRFCLCGTLEACLIIRASTSLGDAVGEYDYNDEDGEADGDRQDHLGLCACFLVLIIGVGDSGRRLRTTGIVIEDGLLFACF